MRLRQILAALPNALTLLRLALALPIAVIMIEPGEAAAIAAFVLFSIAAATDYADGILARLLKAPTAFGRALDPWADKVLVLAVFGALAAKGIFGALELVAFAAIALREFLIGILRAFLARRGQSLTVTPGAKLKTGLQFSAAALFLASGAFGPASGLLFSAACFVFYAAALQSIVTGADYMRRARARLAASR